MPNPKIIPIRTEGATYDVVVAESMRELTARLAPFAPRGDAIVISHRRLQRLHGASLDHALCRADLKATWCLVPQGEQSKSLAQVDHLYCELVRRGVDRHTPIISFGGGVVGDLGGFVAATYMRGVPWIVVPTTLVAQLDSAIGGKVGINLAQGKNLVGSFYQPAFVYCNVALLETLTAAQVNEGLVEALKCGLLSDPVLYRRAAQGQKADLTEIIRRAVQVKARFIRGDTHDTKGQRVFLNLGHTVAHALERQGGYRQWSHGAAVAAGLVAAATLSTRWGYCAKTMPAEITEAIAALRMPTRVPRLSSSTWQRLLRGEKKRQGVTMNYVALRKVAQPLLHPVSAPQLAKDLAILGKIV